MRIICIFLLLIAALSTFSLAPNPKREIRVVELAGSGYELGLQHGKLLKKEIDEIVKKMKINTTGILKKDAEQVLKDFFSYAQFTSNIKKYTPDLYEEVKGIADGSGQTFNDIFVLNLLDEFWVYIGNMNNHHCSGMGVPSVNGSTGYIAQNMDIEKYTEGYQILVRLSRTDNRPEQLILTYPGCIALNGLNETGIGACMNTLMQLNASTNGLPVAFIVRRILNSTDKEELLNFIQSVPHASGQNYIIGIRGEVYDFEASANKVVIFDPKNNNGTLYHTNHPLVNDDVKAWFVQYDPTLSEKPSSSNSYIRLESVEKRMAKNNRIDDDLIKETLRSKDDVNNPVCRSFNSGNGGFTFGSVIMTLTGQPYLQITAGSPDESDYKKFDFTKSN